ncbi:MAG: hypothetical protein JXR19_04790 [Bacteroidia bacterium]
MLTKKVLKNVFLLLILLPMNLYAQSRYSPGYWNVGILASTSSFLSDLGGKDAIGTNDFSDLDLSRTRYALGASMLYTSGVVGFEVGGFYTLLAADDNLTQAQRGTRLLRVETDVVEAYMKFQLTIPQHAGALGGVYFNAGVGAIWFEPKTELAGVTYKLRPLGTEGQNYLPGISPYGKFAPIIPFGVGKKFTFYNGSSISLDISMRKSFTDYLDDVSTNYADPAKIAETGGSVAAELADRSINGFPIGDQRGDSKDMDSYFLIGFKYTIPIGDYRNPNTSCAFGTSWFGNRKGVPKFGKRGRSRRRIFR